MPLAREVIFGATAVGGDALGVTLLIGVGVGGMISLVGTETGVSVVCSASGNELDGRSSP